MWHYQGEAVTATLSQEKKCAVESADEKRRSWASLDQWTEILRAISCRARTINQSRELLKFVTTGPARQTCDSWIHYQDDFDVLQEARELALRSARILGVSI